MGAYNTYLFQEWVKIPTLWYSGVPRMLLLLFNVGFPFLFIKIERGLKLLRF